MINTALVIARLLLAAVFLVAGLAKLHDLTGSRQAVRDFGLPAALATPLGSLLPLAELAVGVALLLGASTWAGSLGALALLLAFIVGISVNLARGKTPDCHCFGQLHSEPVGWPTLARNGVLALLAAFVARQGTSHPGPSAIAWLGRLTVEEDIGLTVAVVTFALLALQGWVIYHLLQQQGRLLLRLDALEGAPSAAQGAAPGGSQVPEMGLPVGTPAPAFQLPTLDGEAASLDALRAAGKPVVLVFTDPHCGPCQALLPDVGNWQRAYGDRLTLVLVSRGSIEENRAKATEHGVAPVLLQEDREVASRYQAHATPSAVLIHPQGIVASPVAAGADAIKALLARTLDLPPVLPLLPRAPAPVPHPHLGNGHAPKPALKVGDAAPAIRLPDLDGTPVDLAGFSGGETVVLFWNPGCGFCQRMLPDLKAWEGDRPEGAPDLLVVSTGTAEDNRAQGIRSALVLDQGFGVSQTFGANGTPMAVLVDAEGRIASELAVGAPPVLALLRGGAVAAA